MICCLLFATLAAPGNLLHNGDFEAGLEGWPANNGWYAVPQGGDVSEAQLGEGEGRQGSRALKLIGGGHRGIALQSAPAYPGRYRVTGWLKCTGMGEVAGGVLVEWIAAENQYLTGRSVIKIKGDTDWTPFDVEVTAPPTTRAVHFDLLTDAPNTGTIWFDEVTMTRIPSDGPPPAAPVLTAASPDGAEACLRVTWSADGLDSVVRLLLYVGREPLAPGGDMLPFAVADPAAGEVLLNGLENGVTYHLAAAAVDADGRRSAVGPGLTVQVDDRQPPRPGWLTAEVGLDGQPDTVVWSPSALDDDLAVLHWLRDGGNEFGSQPVDSRPAPVVRECPTKRIGVVVEDRHGLRSEPVWAEVPARPASGAPPWALGYGPPTQQLPIDANPPPGQPPTLAALGGQQVALQAFVKPAVALTNLRVAFPELPPGWQADARFVEYLDLAKNSRATPKEELVWQAPAKYPDPLSDEPVRDAPAGQLLPLHLRVTPPRGAPAGRQSIRAELRADQGRQSIDIPVQTGGVDLPATTRLDFVYWYNWSEPCRAYGVETESADGWRLLARQAAQMLEYHQNVVVVPYSMAQTWIADDGTLQLDFRRFDRYVETFLAAGVDHGFCLSHFGSRGPGGWEAPTFVAHDLNARRLSDGEPTRIKAYDILPAIQDHLEAKGWLGKFSVHVADEPIKVNRESWLELSATIRAKAPKLPRIDAIHIPNLDGGLEIWVPQVNYLVDWLDEFQAIQAQGNRLWFYVAWVPQGKFPNRMIDSSALKPRVLHWLHYLYGSTGYLHWALNRWSADLLGSLQSPGDTTICWPSRRDVANSSLRWEAERAGIEDLELMYLAQAALERQGLDREAAVARIRAVIAAAVRGATDYERDWAAYEAVKLNLMTIAAAD